MAAASLFGTEAAAVGCRSVRDVETLPASELEPPRQLCVFAVGKEGLGEKLVSGIGHVVDGASPIEGRRAGAAKNPFRTTAHAGIRGAGAAVEMSPRRGHHHPRGVEHRRCREIRALRAHQSGREGPDPIRIGTCRECYEEAPDHVARGCAVGVEQQHPRRSGCPDAAVGRGCKSGVVLLPHHLERKGRAVIEGGLGRTVDRVVVDHDHLFGRGVELGNSSQTRRKRVSVVVGNDDESVGLDAGHSVILAQRGEAIHLTGILLKMSMQQMEGSSRMMAVVSPAAFAALAAVLAGVRAIGWGEAVTASGAVILALVPFARWAGTTLARRGAEAVLIPAAFALTMIGGTAMRRMLMPPLLLLAAWAAVASVWNRTPAAHRPVLAACFGLSARAATGLGLVGFGIPSIFFAILASAAVPWAIARRWGRRPAEIAALLAAVLPVQRWPVAAAVVVVLAVLWGGRTTTLELDRPVVGWIPGVGAAVLLASAVAPWPGFLPAWIPGLSGWPVGVVLAAVLMITTRLRPGVAGAVWFAATFALGPAPLPTPEHRAFNLSRELGTLTAPAGTGHAYIVEFSARGADAADRKRPLAVVTVAGETFFLSTDSADSLVVSRPQGGVGAAASWRTTSRYILDVPAGERPLLSRHPDLDDDVVVRVESLGPARPTPPRDFALPQWLLAAAAVVVALQLLTATWRGAAATVPWMFLVIGALAARAPVEPLHLLSERLAPDLALAAVMAAWLPAAGVWLARQRAFAAVAALLVPLALATPQLTPSMYGDEPFHLILMGSLVEDHDVDISDDLALELHPQNALYSPGWPLFHSPGLGLLLLPGYVVAGRTGALVVLALMGAMMTVVLAARARSLGVGERRVRLLVVVTAATYPLATFATQIWPELVGALAVAVLLVLASRAHGGRVSSAVVAIAAAVVKTRLALLTFPVMAAVWFRRKRVLGLVSLVLGAAAVAAVGWLVMGHPFGPYRRLHHLWPSDPLLVAKVLGGLIFDAAGGLAFTAPLWLAAAAGFGLLWRRGGPGERALLAGCSLTVAALLHSSEWYGGGSPPARYLVAMLPAVFLAGGMVLKEPSRWRRLTVILAPPSVVAWWVFITRPHLSVNPGDGGFWLADALARRFGADARDFFPSFLAFGTATVVVPLMMVGVAALAVWLAGRNPRIGVALRRSWVAVWLVAAAGLVFTLSVLPDRVVEVEAPQVRRSGGSPVPTEGTVSRYSHRRGWRLDDGDRVVVPLRLRDDSEVVLEGWLLGTARRRSDLFVRWDEGPTSVLKWRGGDPPERVVLPAPPGGGRHHLTIRFSAPPEGAVVLDRLVIDSSPGPSDQGGDP